MSVLKNKRNEPKANFRAINDALNIRDKIFDICLHKFYVRLDRIIDPSIDLNWGVEFIRNQICNEIFSLVKYTIFANSIYPYYEFEFNNRRNYQDLAICSCEYIIQIFTFANKTLKGDANKYKDIVESIRLESKIIRGWKKSDNRILETIRKREELLKDKNKDIISKLEKENRELKVLYKQELDKYSNHFNNSPEFALYRKEIEDWENEIFSKNQLPISPFIFNENENSKEKHIINPLLFGNSGIITAFVFDK